MQKSGNSSESSSVFTNALRGVQYSVDFLTAILLLTGQISTVGVYIVSNGFLLAATGPIMGGDRLKGLSTPASMGLDAIDVINALLLIIGQVQVTGPYITSGRLYMVWTGEIFGLPTTEVTTPAVEKQRALAQYMKNQVLHHGQASNRAAARGNQDGAD